MAHDGTLWYRPETATHLRPCVLRDLDDRLKSAICHAQRHVVPVREADTILAEETAKLNYSEKTSESVRKMTT